MLSDAVLSVNMLRIVMLSAAILRIVILSVAMLTVAMLSVALVRVSMLSVAMLSVAIVSVVMLNVVMLSASILIAVVKSKLCPKSCCLGILRHSRQLLSPGQHFSGRSSHGGVRCFKPVSFAKLDCFSLLYYHGRVQYFTDRLCKVGFTCKY